MTEADFSNKNLGMGGAIIISAWITHRDKGAMTKLDVSSNDVCAEGGKCLAEALNGNQVMTELNISDNSLAENGKEEPDMSGIIVLIGAIPTWGQYRL
jgi:hypothetical protein